MFNEDSFHGLFGGGFMWFLWLILLVIVIYMLKDRVGGSSKPSSSEEDALEILKRRYARGEIDEAEYERRKKELEK